MVNDTDTTDNSHPTTNKPEEPPSPRWGTIQEAADATGLSGMTIRRYGRDGLIPMRRKGVRLIEVDLSQLDNLYAPLETLEISK